MTVNNKKYVFILCFSFPKDSIEEEKRGCVDVFFHQNPQYILEKHLYRSDPFSVYVAKRNEASATTRRVPEPPESTILDTVHGSFPLRSAIQRLLWPALYSGKESSLEVSQKLMDSGWSYFSEEKYDKAQESFLSAAWQYPVYIEPYWGLAMVYKELGLYIRTEEMLHKARAIDPKAFWIQEELQKVFRLQKK